MKRVVILGRGAAGKSTLAWRLGEIIELPVIELDRVFWQPGLIAMPPGQWSVLQQKLVAQDSWIVRTYRRHYLPILKQAIANYASNAQFFILRNPRAVRRFLVDIPRPAV